MIDEKQLIEKSKQGDEEAFRLLMESYEKKIFALCYGILKDEGLAKDMTQEAFLKAYQHLKDFRFESHFYTWVYTIARNLCLTLLKKRKLPELELKEEILGSNEPAEDDSEEKEELNEAFHYLSPKQQEIIALFEYEKVPQKEIAARLNIPEGTVRSRVYYARKKMREYLKKKSSEFQK